MNNPYEKLHQLYHEVMQKMEGQQMSDPHQALRVAMAASVATFSNDEIALFCNRLCELSFADQIEQELKKMLDAGLQEDDDDFDPDSIRVGKTN
jgi:hypothetical protein